MKKLLFVVLVSLVLAVLLAGCGGSSQESQGDTRAVVDMRGKTVEVPLQIDRVVELSDGFIPSVMYSFGVEEKVVGLGSDNLKEIDSYTFETVSGETYEYENGMNPVSYLCPWIMDLPAVAKYEEAVNIEEIAALDPDVIIIRKGFGSMNTMEYGTEEDIDKSIALIENLGIPTVILYGPPAFEQPDVGKISQEIEILGEVFEKQDEAAQLNEYLEGIVDMVSQRTADVAEEYKPRVMLFGLSPNARDSGGAGDILCTDTIESYFVTDIVNARNAYEESGGWKIVSTEQILALNPDVLVLPTDWGYHPPEELYGASYYQNLRELDAVKNQRVWALPWTPYNCAKRLEYPIEIMVIAKAAYPELFKDIKIHEWVLEFYKNVYHVDEKTAEGLRSVQWLDWTVQADF